MPAHRLRPDLPADRLPSRSARPRREPARRLAWLAAVVALSSCIGDAAGSPVAATTGAASTGGGKTSTTGPLRLRTSARPLPGDIASLRDLQGVAISSDGSRVLYIARAPSFDPKAKPSPEDTRGGWTVDQQLWVVDRRGGPSRQLTRGKDPVVAARFSPDGHDVAFARRTGGKIVLSILPLGGGEAAVLDLGERGPHDFAWTPDGRSIAFTATAERAAPDRKAAWQRGGAVAWERDWDVTHLFVVPRAGGTPRRIDRGRDTVLGFRFSPDGKRVALLTARSSDPYESFVHQRLVVARVSDGAVERELAPPKFSIPAVEWSPDGRSLAWLTTSRGLSHFDELRVVRVGGGGRPVDVAKGLDLTMMALAWSPDSRDVIALAHVRTATALYRLSARGGAHRRLPAGDTVLFGLTGAGKSPFAVTAAVGERGPTDPAVVDLASGQVRTVAALNPQVAGWRFAPTEVVSWTNKEGTVLEGLLTRTRGAGGGKAPPLLVIPHGGPDGVSTAGWNPWAQYFAARGYSVFQPNYRGGLGYGRAFYEANRGRLGEIELIDIESGVDRLIATGAADPGSLFYGSWSWGGYLAAWTLGHTTRYRAFMVGAGVVDVQVQYVVSDINHGVAADWEYGGRPWNQPEAYDRPNPARHLRGAKSPTLIIHGMEDGRVGFINAKILHRALGDLGVDVAMWAYPREGHGFQEPAHVAHRLEVWAAWNDAHLPR